MPVSFQKIFSFLGLSIFLFCSSFIHAYAADTAPPSQPTSLTATAASSSQINLSWTASTDDVGVTNYIIYRNSSSVAVISGSLTTYSNTGLSASTLYTYTVRAIDAANNPSPLSSSASATTLPLAGDIVPPSQPTSLTATAASSSQINLSWTASTDDVGVTNYIIRRDSSVIAVIPGTATTYANTGLAASAPFTYTVQAVDAANNRSPASSSASATTLSGAGAGSTAPVISALSLSKSASEATFTWVTDIASTSKVSYGTSVDTALFVASDALVTSHSVTLSDLVPETKYYFKVASTNSLGEVGTAILLSSSASRAVVLSDPNTSDYTQILQRSNNDGLALRINWGEVEGIDDVYTWTAIDSDLDLVKQNQKEMTLHILGPVFGALPSWLYTKGAQSYSYNHPVTGSSEDDPVPWDTLFLSEYTALIEALGTHIQASASADAFTAISIAAPAPEMSLVGCRNTGGTYYIDYPTNSIVYDRTAYLNAWKQMVDVYHAVFPHITKLLPVSVGAICLGDNDAQFYRDVLDYARTLEPDGFSPFATDLKSDGSARILNYLSYVDQVPFAFQTTWSATNDPTQKMGTGSASENLQAAVAYGMNHGADYFEIYLDDMISSDQDLQAAIAGGRTAFFTTDAAIAPAASLPDESDSGTHHKKRPKKISGRIVYKTGERIAPWITLHTVNIGASFFRRSLVFASAADGSGIQTIIISENGIKKKRSNKGSISYFAHIKDNASLDIAAYDSFGNRKTATATLINGKVVSVRYH